MPISSSQISALNGGYQSMHMGQMAHANMIGQQTMYGGGRTTGEGMMGSMANLGQSMSPMMGLGAAVAGVDPLSMGVRAGMGAAGSMGMAGGMAVGAGVALPLTAGLMAAKYGASQMMQGGQQQQQFNQMMRSNYGYLQGPGGGGMGAGTMGNMAQGMRQEAGQQSGGQMVGFEELGRLASNMGRMGMAQGVRNAKDFSEKFKQMVTTLKEVAEHMGTSLEEAQKMMAGMKSSGVFGQKRQGRFAQQVAGTAFAGGLATSEVTGMMSIGSQISRSVGGRGRAGAQAGIQAIGNVGVAGQMGILSEEDIYNVTGQAGAQGRQAMATGMLQSSARFLKGGLGRRMVAAMAGKGGTIDEGAMEEFMAGGVGTGRTMQLAHKNIAKMGGRAAFIRNEGRVRGSIMEKFGGLMPAIAMRGWLQQRGMDPESDRARIFMKRRLKGQSDEQIDAMQKLVSNLPSIMQERRAAGEDQVMMRNISQRQGQRGLEGLKRKFEGAKSKVQNRLQQMGADFMSSGSEMIDRFVNNLTGAYQERFERDATRLYDTAMGGGARGKAVAADYFGVGGKLFGAQGGGYEKGRQEIFGARGGAAGKDFATQFREGQGGISGLLQQTGREKFRAAGYRVDARTEGGIKAGIAEAQGMHMGMLTMGRGAQDFDMLRGIGQRAQDEIKTAFASGRIKGRGHERTSSFGNVLHDLAQKDPRLLSVAEKYNSASNQEKSRIMAAVTGGAGALAGEAELFAAPELDMFGGGKFATEGERQEAIGAAFLKGRGAGRVREEEKGLFGGGRAWGIAAGALGGMAGMAPGGLGVAGMAAEAAFGGNVAGKLVHDALGGGAQTRQFKQAIGAVARSKEYRDLTLGALSSDAGSRKASRDTLLQNMQELQQAQAANPAGFSREQAAELEYGQGVLMAQDLAAARSADGSIDPDALKQIASRWNKSPDEVMNMARVVGASALEGQIERRQQIAEQIGIRGRKRRDLMGKTGTIQMDRKGNVSLRGDILDKMQDIGPKVDAAGKMTSAAKVFVQASVQKTLLESQMQGGRGFAASQAFDETFMGIREQADLQSKAISSMSAAQARETADALRGEFGMGQERTRLQRFASISDRIEQGRTRGPIAGRAGRVGGVGAIAKMFGADLDKKDLKRIYGAKGRGDVGAAGEIMEQSGMMDLEGAPGMKKELQEIIRLSRSDDKEDRQSAADRTEKLEKDPAFVEARKKARLAKAEEADPATAKTNSLLGEIKTAISGVDKSIAGLHGMTVKTDGGKSGEKK